MIPKVARAMTERQDRCIRAQSLALEHASLEKEIGPTSPSVLGSSNGVGAAGQKTRFVLT